MLRTLLRNPYLHACAWSLAIIAAIGWRRRLVPYETAWGNVSEFVAAVATLGAAVAALQAARESRQIVQESRTALRQSMRPNLVLQATKAWSSMPQSRDGVVDNGMAVVSVQVDSTNAWTATDVRLVVIGLPDSAPITRRFPRLEGNKLYTALQHEFPAHLQGDFTCILDYRDAPGEAEYQVREQFRISSGYVVGGGGPVPDSPISWSIHHLGAHQYSLVNSGPVSAHDVIVDLSQAIDDPRVAGESKAIVAPGEGVIFHVSRETGHSPRKVIATWLDEPGASPRRRWEGMLPPVAD